MTDCRFARRAANLSSALPGALFPSELGPDAILFDSGFAAPELLPHLNAFADVALSAHREEVLQYSPRQGQPELRQWLADLMNADGCALEADDILIVNGAKNGLDLICRLLLDEGDPIVVTAPMYFTAIPIFRSFGAEFVEVSQDGEGLDVAALERRLKQRRSEGQPLPRFIYDVPEFHNPTGATMSESRRRALLALAQREGIAIVEDTPYRRVRFDGEPVPSLKSLDTTGQVLHVGTFSKLVAPGLRVGWIAAERSLIARLIQLKADGGTSPLLQRIAYEFARSPAFEAHALRVREAYRARRDRMISALARTLPEARLAVPDGGYYVWVTLPPGTDGDALAAAAALRGVHVIAGSRFFAASDGGYPANHAPRNHVRLSYSYAMPEQIDEGVARLADAFRTLGAR